MILFGFFVVLLGFFSGLYGDKLCCFFVVVFFGNFLFNIFGYIFVVDFISDWNCLLSKMSCVFKEFFLFLREFYLKKKKVKMIVFYWLFRCYRNKLLKFNFIK